MTILTLSNSLSPLQIKTFNTIIPTTSNCWTRSQSFRCDSAKQQQQHSNNSKSSSVKKKPVEKKKKVVMEESAGVEKTSRYVASPLPKPPAGFLLDKLGEVVKVSSKRIVTIVDSTNNSPLECIVRRVFKSSRGEDCMLLYPVDTPVQFLKSTNIDGWSGVEDAEVETIVPAAAYALAKIHMHLVSSGFCYTARGGFCYSEEDIIDFETDDQDIDGIPTEGVEITCFYHDGTHYMLYTPSDPLFFVAVKDKNGLLKIADDDISEDPAVISAIDEETEFNALVEEEAALLESLLGER